MAEAGSGAQARPALLHGWNPISCLSLRAVFLLDGEVLRNNFNTLCSVLSPLEVSQLKCPKLVLMREVHRDSRGAPVLESAVVAHVAGITELPHAGSTGEASMPSLN